MIHESQYFQAIERFKQCRLALIKVLEATCLLACLSKFLGGLLRLPLKSSLISLICDLVTCAKVCRPVNLLKCQTGGFVRVHSVD